MSFVETELYKLSQRIAALEESTADHLKHSPLVDQHADPAVVAKVNEPVEAVEPAESKKGKK